MTPKLIFFALVGLGLAVQPALGQTQSLGLEGGPDSAHLNGNDADRSTAARSGFVAGGFLHLGLTPRLALQPELLYVQKGAQTPDGSSSDELDYIEIPVLLEISLGLPVIGPGILLGPALDANVAAGGFSNVNPAEMGLMAGLQVHLDPVLVSGRYEAGLGNVDPNGNLRNGIFIFLAGFQFI